MQLSVALEGNSTWLLWDEVTGEARRFSTFRSAGASAGELAQYFLTLEIPFNLKFSAFSCYIEYYMDT